MAGKLTLDILVGSPEIEAWKYRAIERLLELDAISINHVFIEKEKIRLPGAYRYYLNLEKILLDTSESSTAPRNIQNLFSRLTLYKWEDYKEDHNSENNNILFHLKDGIPTNIHLKRYPQGVMFFWFSANTSPVGFCEILNNSQGIYSSLRLLMQDGIKVLYQSLSPKDDFSVIKTYHSVFWKTANFPYRVLLQHPELSVNLVENNSDCLDSVNAIFNVLAMLRHQVKVRIEARKRRQWILALSSHQNDYDFHRYRELAPPDGVFWADPFPMKVNSELYVFVEIFSDSDKGKIGCLTLNKNYDVINVETVLERDYHLSYPFVFQEEGSYYMIPETKENAVIELYKAIEFPSKWKFEKNILSDVEAVDSTLIKHNDKWWLFTNIKDGVGASTQDELNIFFADDLFADEWKPHPKNPVVSNVKYARMAGRIMNDNGILIRPSQNGSYYYGYGLNFFEIITLNEWDYEEKLKATYATEWDDRLTKMHTFNSIENLSIIDLMKIV